MVKLVYTYLYLLNKEIRLGPSTFVLHLNEKLITSTGVYLGCARDHENILTYRVEFASHCVKFMFRMTRN